MHTNAQLPHTTTNLLENISIMLKLYTITITEKNLISNEISQQKYHGISDPSISIFSLWNNILDPHQQKRDYFRQMQTGGKTFP